jgi:hypothetical protein
LPDVLSRAICPRRDFGRRHQFLGFYTYDSQAGDRGLDGFERFRDGLDEARRVAIEFGNKYAVSRAEGCVVAAGREEAVEVYGRRRIRPLEDERKGAICGA